MGAGMGAGGVLGGVAVGPSGEAAGDAVGAVEATLGCGGSSGHSTCGVRTRRMHMHVCVWLPPQTPCPLRCGPASQYLSHPPCTAPLVITPFYSSPLPDPLATPLVTFTATHTHTPLNHNPLVLLPPPCQQAPPLPPASPPPPHRPPHPPQPRCTGCPPSHWHPRR